MSAIALVCFSAVVGSSYAIDTGTTDTIPGRAVLDRFLNEIQTYQADFAQTLYDEYGEPLEDSTGVVQLAKPGMFRWEYLMPYRQVIVTNGSQLWIFDEDLEQVTINVVPEESKNSPLALLVNGADIDATYKIQSLPSEDGLHWLMLQPKAADAEYKAVEIGVNEHNVVAMRLHDNLNQMTMLTFTNVSKDPTFGLDTFEFKIPDGVDVVSGITSERGASAE